MPTDRGRHPAPVRTPASATVVALVLAALSLGGCSWLGGGSGDDAAPEPSRPVRSSTCQAVRSGIDAFNAQHYRDTTRIFRRAVPLAQARAEAVPSRASRQLLSAVRYYASIAPEDYADAFATFEFKRWQVVTLGQCRPEPTPEHSPGVQA